jgi:hypothetical protein
VGLLDFGGQDAIFWNIEMNLGLRVSSDLNEGFHTQIY